VLPSASSPYSQSVYEKTDNLSKKFIGSTAQFGKEGLRRKFLPEKGGKTQEYFVYFKF
jgi:hypothetical protein